MSEGTKLILSKLSNIDEKLNILGKQLNERLDNVEKRLDNVEKRLDNVEKRLDNLKSKMDIFEEKIIEIQITLDNEISKNIRIVAEGRLNLYRKLDDALKIENEKEMLLIRVNHLENELRRIK